MVQTHFFSFLKLTLYLMLSKLTISCIFKFCQGAIQPIFMRLVLKINLTLFLPVLIYKFINLLSRIYLISIYTKYSFRAVSKFECARHLNASFKKKNPLVEYVFSAIGIEWKIGEMIATGFGRFHVESPFTFTIEVFYWRPRQKSTEIKL